MKNTTLITLTLQNIKSPADGGRWMVLFHLVDIPFHLTNNLATINCLILLKMILHLNLFLSLCIIQNLLYLYFSYSQHFLE